MSSESENEDVYFGPVTAREIELQWRHMVKQKAKRSNYKEEETQKTMDETVLENECNSIGHDENNQSVNVHDPVKNKSRNTSWNNLEYNNDDNDVLVAQLEGTVGTMQLANPPAIMSESCDSVSTDSSSGEGTIGADDNKEHFETETDSTDKSFVSIAGEEPMIQDDEPSPYSPDEGKHIPQQLNTKENVDPNETDVKISIGPKCKIPSLLQPPKLKFDQSQVDLNWVKEMKMKKVAKHRKPDYVLSPAKLTGLLRTFTPSAKQEQKVVNTRKQFLSTPRLKTIPSKTVEMDTPNRKFLYQSIPCLNSVKGVKGRDVEVKKEWRPQSAPQSSASAPSQTKPKHSKVPVPMSKHLTQLKYSRKTFDNIVSPVREYIRNTPTQIIRNQVPIRSATRSDEILAQEEASSANIHQHPHNLLPKCYFSAEKALLKTVPSPTNLPKMGEKQRRILVTPKHVVVRHQGRILNEMMDDSALVRVPSPLAANAKALGEESFAMLQPHNPYISSDILQVSVLEKH